MSLTYAQERYWVFFTDKDQVQFHPLEYFHPYALQRRINAGIPIDHISDYPVRDDYKKSIELLVTTIRHESRWFNAVSVEATSSQIAAVAKLNFVRKTEPFSGYFVPAEARFDTILDNYEAKLLSNQLNSMQGNKFREAGYNGKGIRIAIFDGGFPEVDSHPAFKHLIDNNKIIDTYDFARKKENVFGHNAHGTMVLSCIAGKKGDQPIGLATEAEFLLARTEVNSEPKSEEDNWLAAAEWSDKHGVHIINSSLGYTYHRYFPEQMDGNTSLVVKAANMAATKGILVINAMGNDGDMDWQVLGTPADADSILSIGGIDSKTGYRSNFSSFGPTYDKRLKPNLSAYSNAIVATKNGLKEAFGTSFATPLISGFAACAWQKLSKHTNMELKTLLEMSGNLYPYFDYAHGYGIPQAHFFLQDSLIIQRDDSALFKTQIKKNKIIIEMLEDCDDFNVNDPSYLYYHIENTDGYLDSFFVIEIGPDTKVAAKINTEDIDSGSIVRIHFKCQTEEIIID